MKKHFLKTGLLGLLMAGILVQPGWSQSDPTGKRRVSSTYAITNAHGTDEAGRPYFLLTSLTTFVGLAPIVLERSLQAKVVVPMAVSAASISTIPPERTPRLT